jgi:large subunit ribosomal protein L23
MDLSIYDIIQGPIISDKAYKLNKSFKKLVLKVHPHSNKVLIKEALERLFSVKVDKVAIVVRQPKNKRLKGRAVRGVLVKKAIITLAEGYSLDLLDQSGAQVVPAEMTSKYEKAE